MDRRGFVSTGMAAGLAGAGVAGSGLGGLLSRSGLFRVGKTLPNGNVRLSSNENPLGLSPKAREALIDAIVDANRYPSSADLTNALASYLGVQPAHLTLGFGSTEILQVITHAYQGPSVPLIVAEPTFEDIGDYQATMAYNVVSIPLTKDLQHDVGRMREAASKRPSVVYFCNPNNPTGTVTAAADIDAWIADAPETTTFVMDEAYLEYVTDPRYGHCLKWVDQKPNVIVVRTFSKIFAMAGLRLGYAVSHPDTAVRLREWTVQNSPNVLAAAAGIASLQDDGLVARSVKVNEEARAIVHTTLDELGLEYLPTNTNFIMHRISGDLTTYIDRMRNEGLLVGRRFPPMLEWNRVSFGLPDEMDRWAATLKDFRKKGWV
ncbi:MAG: aminotransferase class I/II-fold pyridoxal phosphate-dependent enzyme [Gemmatimonadota bacterium]|nr:aminotransferase class I/II-fold pyridoxal phosphate-dependent enzyme [Gemmatimonadota bacterium]